MGEEGARRVPPLHVVTDDGVLARTGFADGARGVLERGGPEVALHLRGPRTAGRLVYELAAGLAPVARAAGALLLVNDRVDVALAAGADGAHLGHRSLLPADARALLGAGRWVGASVRTPAEARDAVAGGADYLFVGHLYATPSHPGEDGVGPGRIAELRGPGVPVVGIGGITPQRVREVVRAGAAGVAVVRGVWDTGDPARAVSSYLDALRVADER